MQKINFQNLPSTTTPLNATNLNAIQTNIENVFNGSEPMGNIIVEGITSKNILGVLNYSTTIRGITASVNNNQFTISGTANNDAVIDFVLIEDINSNIGTLTKSFSQSGTYTNIQTSLRDSNGSLVGLYSNSLTNNTGTLTANAHLFRIQVNNGVSVNATFKVMIEKGSTATTFSEYKDLGYISGSNANGNYIKYDDGTLIQWGSVAKTKFLNTSSTYTAVQGINWYRSHLATQSLPIPFIDTNYKLTFSLETGLNGSRFANTRISSITNSDFEMQLISVDDYLENSNGYKDIINVHWIAIGRWK